MSKEIKSFLLNVKINKNKEVVVSAIVGRGGSVWIVQAIEPNWMSTLQNKWSLKASSVPKAKIGFMKGVFDNWNDLWPAVNNWLNERNIKVDLNRCIPDFSVFVTKRKNEVVVFDRRPRQLRPRQVIRSRDLKVIEDAILESGQQGATFEVNESNQLVDAATAIKMIKETVEKRAVN